ncbi:hypothetical protein LZ198_03545 [Myxococcus sp. K15C18031901]|uniref:hypothetical protein n=1 Tax=Myxococcus dinghuensis TaxID=2906761 RepID=UPI0020A82389|nr:hypothetical protein [Myxococcus dinghuensis]MCP3097946.1 hypothetical protein [Myxococcus dinghuensis]
MAEVPIEDGPPPVPLIGIDTDGSKVVLVEPSGETRVLAECSHTEERKMLAGPERGQVKQYTQGCRFWSLAVHPPTGKWMVAAGVPGDGQFSRMIRFSLGGRDITTPKSKAGRPLGGTLLVMGDLDGIAGFTPGVLETWNAESRQYAQMPQQFTEDGSRVFVSNSNSAITEQWSWSFSRKPEGIRVLPRGVTDTAGLHFVQGDNRILARNDKEGLRLVTMDPSGTKPWKVGPVIQKARRGVVTPFVVGDTLVFYKEGTQTYADCDDPGTYRRVDLKTGQERIFRSQDGWCVNDLRGANRTRRTVFFIEGLIPWKMDPHLFEYSLDDDSVRELPVGYVTKMHDVSVDGRYLALAGSGGLVVHDVDTGRNVRVTMGALHDTWAVKFLEPR